MSNPVFKLGKFTFRSTSSDVNVFFEGQEGALSEKEAELIHTENEIKDAYDRGVAEGQAPLNEEGARLQNELAAQQLQMQEDREALANAFQQTLSAIESQMTQATTETSFKLAELIISKELENKEVLLKMITSLLADIQSGSETLIKLSPQDFEMIGNDLSSATLRCLPDVSLQSGDL
ncbi:MAG: hypothetical protein HRT88_21105, partial [Lentisphaeraceae bacterium]|nr:hypothetical protein [Lentisphaeraceae bacterium]